MNTQTLQSATREQIFARVAELLAEAFDLSPEQVRLDSHLIDDLDLDSIDAIDLVVGLEEETGLDVSESERVTPAAHLVDDLDLDSIDAIDLVVRLQEETGLEVEEDELKQIRLVRDLVDLVDRKLVAL